MEKMELKKVTVKVELMPWIAAKELQKMHGGLTPTVAQIINAAVKAYCAISYHAENEEQPSAIWNLYKLLADDYDKRHNPYRKGDEE